MADYKLTKKERNELYEFVEAIGLRPLDFALVEERRPPDAFSKLSHVPTGHSFLFGVAHAVRGGTVCRSDWTPMFDEFVTRQHTYRAEQLKHAQRWLRVVKEEHETVDLWNVAAEEAALVAGGAIDEGDRGFTIQEQKVLAERLTLLEQKIVELGKLSTEQRVDLGATIQQTKDAATRTSRTDWKAIFVGNLFSVLARLALESSTAHQVLHYANLYVGPLLSKVVGLLH